MTWLNLAVVLGEWLNSIPRVVILLNLVLLVTVSSTATAKYVIYTALDFAQA